MHGKRFREYSPKQVMALPPSLDDWLPGDHPAHFIGEAVDQFDLSTIYADYYERRGQPPYVYIFIKLNAAHCIRHSERALASLRRSSCRKRIAS